MTPPPFKYARRVDGATAVLQWNGKRYVLIGTVSADTTRLGPVLQGGVRPETTRQPQA